MDEKTKELLAELLAYPSVKPEWKAPGRSKISRPTGSSSSKGPGRAPSGAVSEAGSSRLPIIPISFVKDGQVLNYFSMVATVGTPQTVTAQELRLECMFPADEATEARHLEVMRKASAS
jgi:hypothetical protein